MGEPLRLPRRQRDPRLPLFIKLLNVEVEALEEDPSTSAVELEQLAFAGNTQEASSESISSRLERLFEPSAANSATNGAADSAAHGATNGFAGDRRLCHQ